MLEERQLPVEAEEIEALEDEPPAAADVARGHSRPEGFQVPADIWYAVFACYAVFFVAIALATGGSGPARLVLAVSGLFILAYFTVASILAALTGVDRGTVDHARPLNTIYGPLSLREVRIQLLTVPSALVLFGLCILTITGFAGI